MTNICEMNVYFKKKGTTLDGFKFKISKKKCTLYIPNTLGIYSFKVQQTFLELWNDTNLEYFNQIIIKKIPIKIILKIENSHE